MTLNMVNVVVDFFLSLCSLISIVNGFTLDLSGQWQISNSNRGHRINGSVPGTVHTALYKNKIIQDPYYRNNDAKYRWIGLDDWTYSRSFNVYSRLAKKKSILLIAEGLDTFSTISINGKPIGISDNMYVRYQYDITNVIKNGSNTIEVAFRSAVKEAEKLSKESAYKIPPECKAPAQHGECHVQFIRKAQCSFSWDWGPSFPVQGIWKDIYIFGYDTAVIRDLSGLPKKDSDGTWSVDVEVYYDVNNSTDNITGKLVTDLKLDKTVSYSQSVTLTPTSNSTIFNLKIPKGTPVDLWWPNGYGKQTLYELDVRFISDGKSQEVFTKSIKIGFRTVEIVQDPVSLANKTLGLTFFYRVNGVPVYFKGTNWIPADSFLERVTNQKTYIYLKSAAEVHINSMRVWGGGVYETDYFYNMADALGIMIWSDFMFSVALYPSTKLFLDSVAIETRQQMRRLKHHPSIVVWAGNNENELGLRQGWYGVLNVEPYKSDYVKLYIDTIGSVVKQEDSTREYLSSSPSDGLLTKQENWIAKNPASEFYGDIHYYNYFGDLWNWKTFQIPRFASEYGSESWCNYDTIEKVFESEDLDYWSDMAEWRQHHGLGNIQMIMEAMTHIKLPNASDRKQRFEDLIYVTQIHQAMAMRTETEHYRRLTNQLYSDGRGLTMGALYWQLNDIWQAPTWASIDYDMKWKMLHYYARHFFNPVLISPYINGSNLNIYMVVDEIPNDLFRNNDDLQTLEFRPTKSIKEIEKIYPSSMASKISKSVAMTTDNVVIMEMYTWNNFNPLKSWKISYQLNQTSGKIFDRNLDDMLKEAGCSHQKECFLYFYFNSKSQAVSETWLPLSYFTAEELQPDLPTRIQKAQILVTDVSRKSATVVRIVLSTNTIAPFVWLNSKGFRGYFSDNGFIMKDPLIELTFSSWEPEVIDLNKFRKSLSVKSLMDIYH